MIQTFKEFMQVLTMRLKASKTITWIIAISWLLGAGIVITYYVLSTKIIYTSRFGNKIKGFDNSKNSKTKR